eukprot:SAG11_NODE_13373_length_658_cov_0.776386_1_plen_97_part_00
MSKGVFVVVVTKRRDEMLDNEKYDLPEPEPGETWTRADFQLPVEGRLALTYFETPSTARYDAVLEVAMLRYDWMQTPTCRCPLARTTQPVRSVVLG